MLLLSLMELESSVGIKKAAQKNNLIIITVVFSSVMEDAQCTTVTATISSVDVSVCLFS